MKTVVQFYKKKKKSQDNYYYRIHMKKDRGMTINKTIEAIKISVKASVRKIIILGVVVCNGKMKRARQSKIYNACLFTLGEQTKDCKLRIIMDSL